MLLAAYCGLYVGLFAGALSWLGRRRSASMAIAAAPFLWVTAEWVRGWLMGGFPWGNLGYSQYRQLAVIQIAELGGAYAVSFVVVAVNAALAGPWCCRRAGVTARGIAGLLVGATLIFGNAATRGVPRRGDGLGRRRPAVHRPASQMGPGPRREHAPDLLRADA